MKIYPITYKTNPINSKGIVQFPDHLDYKLKELCKGELAEYVHSLNGQKDVDQTQVSNIIEGWKKLKKALSKKQNSFIKIQT